MGAGLSIGIAMIAPLAVFVLLVALRRDRVAIWACLGIGTLLVLVSAELWWPGLDGRHGNVYGLIIVGIIAGYGILAMVWRGVRAQSFPDMSRRNYAIASAALFGAATLGLALYPEAH